ncbi:MAG: methionine synthase [Chloroflexi bacterium]|nr:methionine synthase [Chloroflexota bacterium]
MNLTNRKGLLAELLGQRILVAGNANGTRIQALDLSSSDFGGPEYEGCNEYLNVIRPEIVKEIHRSYLEVGADIILTNSFGSTPLVLGEYGLAHRAKEISAAAARNAREVVEEFSTKEHPRFVAGSMGPTTRSISVTGGVTWDELADHYYVQAAGLIEGGADFLLVETSQDTLNVKAALTAVDRLAQELDVDIPVAVQCTIETMGTTLGGQDVEAFYTSVAHRDLLWIGMNCSTGPEFMRDHVRTMARISRFPVSVIPNAGLPDEDGNYNETPEMISRTLQSFVQEGWINVIGGCCGTTPEHIRLLVKVAQEGVPRETVERRATVLSGLETLTVDEDTRPVLVGERTNVLGSRRFKRLIAEGKLDEATEIGRHQVRGGAHIVDVCLQDPDRDELADVVSFLEGLVRKVKVPIMLDSTDEAVLYEALKRTPGKSIINSINLEDGEERFGLVVPLARQFGAALVVGCIDDDKQQAQAVTRERKLAIAERSYKLLTEKYGVRPEDIIFDPLVFPVGTGDKNYIGAGVETVEGVRLIKEKLPHVKTILGISNVSFGLPPAGREVLNSVMLYHCVQAGLDMAIVNTERLVRYASIPEEERRLAEDLIWWRGDDPIAAFADHFRERKVERSESDRKKLPLDERLASCVIEGTRDGLFEDLDEAMAARTPLEIINGPLMAGMDEVGRLFGLNQLIVAEVLGSAETMKAAVSYLEPHMEKSDAAKRGTIVLATVKGDVHDIGKNLVDIILSNNGYKVINLGIKVPPQDLIQAYRDHVPDIIGLSGLLVKSAQMMVETVRDLRDAEVDCPILVGGAALTNRFTRLRIAPGYEGLVGYAKDAMTGLALANRLRDPQEFEKLSASIREEAAALEAAEAAKRETQRDLVAPERPRAVVTPVEKVPTPPDLRMHPIKDYDLAEIFEYINPVMLYVRHLGYRGRFEEALKSGDQKALDLREKVRQVEDVMLERTDIFANAVYKFFPTASEGDDVLILSPDGKDVLERFHFGRQSGGEGLCLADYLLPRESGRPDYLAAFVTTIGPGIRQLAAQWQERGDYLASHILQLLALEGAEAFAELLHQKIRAMWGFPDPEDITAKDLFKANYQGRRYSFGYPACPRLEDQAQLWRLLEPEGNMGVSLTEGYMMEPEGSVSALVFHHPQAKYFNLSPADAERLEAEFAVEAG